MPNTTRRTIKQTIFCKKNYNKVSFKNCLPFANWHTMYLQTNCESLMQEFTSIVANAVVKNAPPKTVYIRERPKPPKIGTHNTNKPWINQKCKDLSKQKESLLKAYSADKNKYTHETYKACRNKLNNGIKYCQKQYYKLEFLQLDTEKHKWKFINNIRQSNPAKAGIEVIKNCFGDLITNPTKIANLYNLQICNVWKLPRSNYRISH